MYRIWAELVVQNAVINRDRTIFPNDFNDSAPSGRRYRPELGRVLHLGSLGRILSTSNNPRIVQSALKLHF